MINLISDLIVVKVVLLILLLFMIMLKCFLSVDIRVSMVMELSFGMVLSNMVCFENEVECFFRLSILFSIVNIFFLVFKINFEDICINVVL